MGTISDRLEKLRFNPHGFALRKYGLDRRQTIRRPSSTVVAANCPASVRPNETDRLRKHALKPDGRVDDALEAARLRIEAYPEDYLSYEWLANLLYRHESWVGAMENYAIAYGMLSTRERTAEVAEELAWYEQRMMSVRERLEE